MKMKFCLLAGLLFWVTGVFGVHASEEVLAPKIVCDEPVYDFGEIANHNVVEHEYVIRNAGTLSLEIRSVRASCGCTAVQSSQSVISPGESGTIQTRFDLRGRSGMQYKTVFVESNDPQTPSLHLQLRGTAVEALRVEPTALFYGRLELGALPTRVLRVIANQGPLQLTSFRSDNPHILLRELPREAGANESERQLEVTISPEHPTGQLRGTIYIKTDRDDQPELAVAMAAFLVSEQAEAQ